MGFCSLSMGCSLSLEALSTGEGFAAFSANGSLRPPLGPSSSDAIRMGEGEKLSTTQVQSARKVVTPHDLGNTCSQTERARRAALHCVRSTSTFRS